MALPNWSRITNRNQGRSFSTVTPQTVGAKSRGSAAWNQSSGHLFLGTWMFYPPLTAPLTKKVSRHGPTDSCARCGSGRSVDWVVDSWSLFLLIFRWCSLVAQTLRGAEFEFVTTDVWKQSARRCRWTLVWWIYRAEVFAQPPFSSSVDWHTDWRIISVSELFVSTSPEPLI